MVPAAKEGYAAGMPLLLLAALAVVLIKQLSQEGSEAGSTEEIRFCKPDTPMHAERHQNRAIECLRPAAGIAPNHVLLLGRAMQSTYHNWAGPVDGVCKSQQGACKILLEHASCRETST